MLNASALSSTLRQVKESKTSQQRGYSAYDDDDDTEDSDSEKVTLISRSSLASSATQRPSTLKHKSPSKPKQNPPVVINLISDDEEVAAPAQTRIIASSKKYVSANNTHLMAYGQTNNFMHYSRNRKHGQRVRMG
jgi:hypothetical protein